MPGISSRSFLPPNLSGNMLGGIVPLGAGNSLPANPNPLAQASPAPVVPATAGGIEEAMAKRGAQDNTAGRLSETGMKSGVTYKVDTEGSKTGTSAFDTLDGYMKTAGLNSFQAQFFTRLVQSGLNDVQMRSCVKIAGDRFGDKIGFELAQGLEQLEKSGNLVKEFGKGVWHASKGKVKGLWEGGKNLLGIGAAKAAPAISEAAPAISKAAPVVGRTVAEIRRATAAARTTAARAAAEARRATAASNAAANTTKLPFYRRPLGEMAKNTEAYRQAASAYGKTAPLRAALTGNTAVGSLTGAFNPYTGALTDKAWNPDGSYNWGNLALNTAGGGIAGAFGGKFGTGQQVRNAMLRADAWGAGGGLAGWGLNTAGHALGDETLQGIKPENWTRYGFAGGLFSGPIAAGVRKVSPPWASALGNTLKNSVKAHPVAAPFVATLGLGTGYLGYKANNTMNAVTEAVANAPATIKAVSQEVVADLPNTPMGQDLQDVVAKVEETTDRVNNMMGGEGGGLGGLGSMFGGVGTFLKNNPWMVPLLLAGVGAGTGYMMGGAGGAALGGIGVPLLYALMSGQFKQDANAGDTPPAAPAPAAAARAKENAKVQEVIAKPVAEVGPKQKNIPATQQAQQDTWNSVQQAVADMEPQQPAASTSVPPDPVDAETQVTVPSLVTQHIEAPELKREFAIINAAKPGTADYWLKELERALVEKNTVREQTVLRGIRDAAAKGRLELQQEQLREIDTHFVPEQNPTRSTRPEEKVPQDAQAPQDDQFQRMLAQAKAQAQAQVQQFEAQKRQREQPSWLDWITGGGDKKSDKSLEDLIR